MAAYTYQPIDLDAPAIRLLRLLRGHFEDDIYGELFDGQINQSDDGIPYEALSYVWGSTEKEAEITLNDNIVPITSNLHMALQHLRSEDEDRILWVDAICINQEDEREKTHQVKQMGHIYKEAEIVVVWLGKGTEKSDLIMNFMKYLHDDAVKLGGDWRSSPLYQVDYYSRTSFRTEMNLLLKRPWFRRIWILQEIANARTAMVQCGKMSVSARTFAQVPSILGLEPDPHCQAVLDIMPGLSRKESWWSSQRDLRTLLAKFRASDATDKRDMFYALFGISSDASQNDTLRPDYSKSLQQVIEDVALFLTSTTNHHDSSYSGFIHWSLPQFFQKLDSLESAVLRAAAEHGKEAAVKCLLETRGVKIDMMDMPGFASLHKATLNGHEAVARQLIKNGANVNLPDATGHTPLSLAVSKGHQAIVKLLLSTENINPNARDRQGYTALSTAVWYGDEAVVELLLAADGIDLSHTVEQISKWPIMVAKSSIGRRVGIAAAEKRF